MNWKFDFSPLTSDMLTACYALVDSFGVPSSYDPEISKVGCVGFA